MKILLTGATGQVGREVARACNDGDMELLPLGSADLDISDQAAIRGRLAKVHPDLVINAAAYTGTDAAEHHCQQALRINRDGPGYLAAICAEMDIPLMHLSTDFVFNGFAGRAYVETDPPSPLGVYGLSKWQGEEAVRYQCSRYLILRVSWVFGRYGHNFVKTVLRLAQERDTLHIVSDQHGCPTPARAIGETLAALARRFAERGELAWGTYHYCGKPVTTWYEFAVQVLQAASEKRLLSARDIAPVSSEEFRTPAPRPPYGVLDCSLIRRRMGVSQPDWRPAMAETVASVLGEQDP